MSIFGGSERFPNEPARSPGPVYGINQAKPRGNVVVMKADYTQLDESSKWSKRESWIGSPSPHIPVVSKGPQCLNNQLRLPRLIHCPLDAAVAPGRYSDNMGAVKKKAPIISFPKSTRFISQKVNMTDKAHQRELMASESPGPKYNVNSMSSYGGKNTTPQYSFAPSSPSSKTRLPNVDSPRRGHRESWLCVINRNGVLVMPGSPSSDQLPPTSTPAQDQAAPSGKAKAEVRQPEQTNSSPSRTSHSNYTRENRIGSVFGSEHRFGVRQEKNGSPRKSVTGSRVQLISSKHTRENMGEFSPGPIYDPYNPECSGGRLAPSPRSERRPPPPGTPRESKNPHANMSSRSSWLAGNVRKNDGVETVLMRTADVPPGPGSYAEPPSSFAVKSHNVKAKTSQVPVRPSRPCPRALARGTDTNRPATTRATTDSSIASTSTLPGGLPTTTR